MFIVMFIKALQGICPFHMQNSFNVEIYIVAYVVCYVAIISYSLDGLNEMCWYSKKPCSYKLYS